MSWRHFSANKAMAIRKFWQDEPDGGVTVITEQDVESIVDHNKVLQGQHGSGWAGDLHQVASLPMTTFMELHKQGITRDQKAMRSWLNSSENRAFRTRGGNV